MSRAEKVARHKRRAREFAEVALRELDREDYAAAGRSLDRARDFAHLANAEQRKGTNA